MFVPSMLILAVQVPRYSSRLQRADYLTPVRDTTAEATSDMVYESPSAYKGGPRRSVHVSLAAYTSASVGCISLYLNSADTALACSTIVL